MTKSEKSWILYDFANSAYSIVITTAILPVFFKSVACKNFSSSTSTAYWGYANSIATALIAILAPLLGAIGDKNNSKKRFFILFCSLGIISTTCLSFIDTGDYIPCLIIYIISVIGFSSANIFYDSFLVNITSKKNMDLISSLGYGFGYIGGTIPFIICMLLIMNSSKLGINTIFATKISFLITAIWWLIFSIPLLKNVKTNKNASLQTNKDKFYIRKSLRNLFQTLKKIYHNKKLLLFFIAFFFYIDGVHTIITMSTSFGLDIGLSSSKLMIILLVLQIVAFPCAIIYGKLSKKYSSKNMILVGIITYTFVSIYAFFIHTELQFWILSILVGSAQGGIQALSRSYFGKLIPKENSAEYYGIYNIFGRISSIFGPFLVGVITSITNNTRYGVLSLIILFLIGAILFSKVDSIRIKQI